MLNEWKYEYMLLKTLIYYINGLSALHKQPLKSSQTNNDLMVDSQWTQNFLFKKNLCKNKELQLC